MRRGRIFIYLALFLLVVLAGAYLFLRSRSAPEEAAAPAPVLIDIVIAKQNIPQGAEITDEVLGSISLPEGTDFGVMFRYDQRDLQVVGKIAKYPIAQGVVITQPMIGETGDIASIGPEWANLISPGMTAIAIPVSRLSSVAYGAADGAHVNVIACFIFVDIDSGFQSKLPNSTASVFAAGFPFEAPSLSASIGAAGSPQGRIELDPTLQQPVYIVPQEDQRPRTVCQTVIQDVAVLKLGDFPVTDQVVAEDTDENAPPPAPGENTAPPAPVTPDIVTLVVSPQDATSLTYMLYGGAKLTLTLRGAKDTSRVETQAATLQFLLSQYAIPVPAKLPYAVEPRIDALGDPALGNTTEPTP
ncbi:MAG: hypothetical protein ISR59_06185 [Anaerolineales bacterium]|uniref:SAF domain-containing protein n=1 Tax=Candidatus Desulfolinea nitratireducens TaxID=2841698 RepID=A0A8J6THF9_9CHLR|nr:hypothetical protein [Candidatus Desulfolinea nitratireducens]MBL6960680.1 hypothetical protein [Anaerolineales bacterium]